MNFSILHTIFWSIYKEKINFLVSSIILKISEGFFQNIFLEKFNKKNKKYHYPSNSNQNFK